MSDETLPDLDTIIQRFVERYQVRNAADFNLALCGTSENVIPGLKKKNSKELLEKAKERLSDLQSLLHANGTSSVLIVLQGMDTAGKDGTIRHVMSGVNPQGVSVVSFRQPGPHELQHGFLWRLHIAAPSSGRITIFNRSQYEDVLITRVHPHLLEREHLPGEAGTPAFWQARFDDIRSFEHYLARQGTLVLKFFLNISKKEQRQRLLDRLDDPSKQWKFSPSDIEERSYWDDYQSAYQDAIRQTSTDFAPWFAVPADNKWYARLVVVSTIVKALTDLRQQAPNVPSDVRSNLENYRKQLLAETNN
ncbi:MAG: PPK2 family polyphosphate kinase [Acetobacter sp.]